MLLSSKKLSACPIFGAPRSTNAELGCFYACCTLLVKQTSTKFGFWTDYKNVFSNSVLDNLRTICTANFYIPMKRHSGQTGMYNIKKLWKWSFQIYRTHLFCTSIKHDRSLHVHCMICVKNQKIVSNAQQSAKCVVWILMLQTVSDAVSFTVFIQFVNSIMKW